MRQYVVDAFTDEIFGGNPAAICILSECIDESLMMSITLENNLSETAFAVKEGEKYHLRWFTPGGEIDLCGHATLACAYVLMNYYEKSMNKVVFTTISGDLAVLKKDHLYELEFPAYDLKNVSVTDVMEKTLGVRPLEAYIGRDLLCVFDNEDQIRNLKPDLEQMKQLDGLLLHVTAPGSSADCVSRSFAPKLNVSEDPVCGSGHCHIIPYWSKQLKKNKLIAYQASKRGGTLHCRFEDNKVFMAGEAALFSVAELNI